MADIDLDTVYAGRTIERDGTRRKVSNGGYVMIYAPDHPKAKKGYVFEHIIIIEKKLGRLLRPGEIVHHKNQCTWDNRPENLQVRRKLNHWQHHMYQKMMQDWHRQSWKSGPVKRYNLKNSPG